MPSIEQLLEEDGQRWRQETLQAVHPTEQTPSNEAIASIAIVDSPRKRNLRGRHLPALVAAAIVVIIGGVVFAVVSQTGQTARNRAGGNPSESQQLEPQPGATDPRQPIPARGVPAPAVPVSAVQAAHMLSFPWKLTFASNSSSTIGIYYYGAGGPGCGEVKGIYVKETAESVLIDVAALPPTGRACADVLHIGSANITLEHPLGDRSIIHAVVSNGYRISNF